MASLNSDDIKPRRADELARKIRPMLAFIGRLRRRMEVLGFPPDDAFYISTGRAHDALQELHVRVHYLSCASGVARMTKPKEPQSGSPRESHPSDA